MNDDDRRFEARVGRIPEVTTLDLKRYQIYQTRKRTTINTIISERSAFIQPNTPIASMGSCFAREIKLYLERNSYNYLSVVGEQEAEHGSAMWERVYSTPCILQEIRRGLRKFESTIFEFPDGRAIDPYRKHVGRGRIFANANMARENCARAAKAADETLRTAEVFIITLGLSEVWFDGAGGAFAEPLPKVFFDEKQHSMKLLSPEENIVYLRAALDLLKENYPHLKIILTVSPVPLRATFVDRSAVVSNNVSKASLLWAAHNITTAYDNVYYFPSYELVMNCAPDPFEWDFRHVTASAIETVMSGFEEMFVI